MRAAENTLGAGSGWMGLEAALSISLALGTGKELRSALDIFHGVGSCMFLVRC